MPDRTDPDILPLILYLSDERYRKLRVESPPRMEGINLQRLLEVARRNKLSYHLSKRAMKEGYSQKIFRDVVEEGDRNLTQQEQTLKFISSVLGETGAEFLIIKSYKALPYTTVDIDIMVKENDFSAAVQALEAQGAFPIERGHRIPLPMFLERRLDRAEGANLKKEGLLEIDVYQNTTWTGWLCLDNDFIWKETRLVEICGVECNIPNREADLLISMAHVIFCHGFINLLDFLYMNSLLQEDLDFEALFREAEKYGWGYPFRALVSRIRELYHTLYYRRETPKSVTFPYLIPFNIILNSYRGVARASGGGLASSLSNWINVGLKLASILVYR